jgi:hypothetical protein
LTMRELKYGAKQRRLNVNTGQYLPVGVGADAGDMTRVPRTTAFSRTPDRS